MRSLPAFLVSLLLFTLPAVAWAGGPPASSPEPGLWIFAAIGAAPILALVAWQVLTERKRRTALAPQSPQR